MSNVEAQGRTGTSATLTELNSLLFDLRNAGVILTMEGEEEGSVAVETEPPQSIADAFDPKVKDPGPSDLGTDFLKSLPPEKQEELAPIIKEWDKNVAKRFEKIHSDYKGQLSAYEGIDPSDAREALQLREMIISQPETARKYIQDEYMKGNISEETKNTLVDEVEESTSILDRVDPEVRDMLLAGKKAEEVAKQLWAEREQEKAIKADQEAAAEFVSVYEKIQKSYTDKELPKADRETILRLIATELEPEEAFAKYYGLIEGAIEERSKRKLAPPVLGSGSVPLVNGTPIHKLNTKDRKNAINQMLSRKED